MKRKAAIEIIEWYRDNELGPDGSYCGGRAYYASGMVAAYNAVLKILAKDANADDFLTKGDEQR